MFCFGTPRGLPKLSTETCFFLNHEPKLLPKLASPIRDKNCQNIAYWYKTYIRRNKKEKKVSVSCKHRPKAIGRKNNIRVEERSDFSDPFFGKNSDFASCFLSVLVQKKDLSGQNTNIQPKTSDPPSVVGLVVGPPPET